MTTFDHFIDGEYRASASGDRFESRNPATGEVIGEVARGGGDEVDAAVDAAGRAFRDGRWSGMRASKRAAVLEAIARGIRENADELTELEVRDSGSTRAKASAVDVGGGAHWFRTMAGFAGGLDEPEPLPQTLRPGPSYNYLRREPIGVGAGIVPWNFPFQMACWKASMALAAGNSLVLKPAPETSLTASRLGEICAEAGLPDGVLNVVHGYGEEVGAPLSSHPGVDKISFTGSVEVGRAVMAAAAPTVKNITLELGGKSAQIVLPGADLDLAVDGALYAIFFHSGQVCTAGSRLLVSASMHDEFVARLVERATDIVVGLPDDRATTMGPLVSERQLERVLGYIERGREEGATVAAGGNRLTDGELANGYFLEPTIFTDVKPTMDIAQEEIFGPVLSVLTYDDVDEAVEIANGTIFALAGGVWGPTTEAQQVAHRLRAGTVWVNDYQLLNPAYPFGGAGQSGLGREHGLMGLHEWTEAKHVHVGLDSRRQTKAWFDMTVPVA